MAISVDEENKLNRDRFVRLLREIADDIENANYVDGLDYNFTFDAPEPERIVGAEGYFMKRSNITMVNMTAHFDIHGKKHKWQKVSSY